MIKIGKYVNTHGIKGEIRILSDFSRKDLIFVPGNKLYIDNKEYIIKTYRKHKSFDMVLFEGINDINDILYLKGKDVYSNDINEFILEDLYTYKVSINNKLYNINSIIENKKYKILVTDFGMIPYIDEFIENKDDINKIVYIKYIDKMEEL